MSRRKTQRSRPRQTTVRTPHTTKLRGTIAAAVANHEGGSESRKTGLSPIAQAPWGTHICMFYETKEDLVDAATAYFSAGIADNEAAIWAVSEPITVDDATHALRAGVPDFDRRLAAGQIEILPGHQWYLDGKGVDVQRVISGWRAKLDAAVAAGYRGLRVSGNAFWFETNLWRAFYEYEQVLDQAIAGHRMLVLCTYSLLASRAVDLMDVTRAHHASVALRRGAWEFLETPDLKFAKLEIGRLNDAIALLTRPFPGHGSLTPRERRALAHIATGKSNKEVGLALGISPRTAEFHRSNILRKLGARNSVELVRVVLGGRK